MRLEWHPHATRAGYGRLVFVAPGGKEVGAILPVRIKEYTPPGSDGVWVVHEPLWLHHRDAAMVARRVAMAYARQSGNSELVVGGIPSEEPIRHVRPSDRPGVWIEGGRLGAGRRVIPAAARNGGFGSCIRKDKWQGKTWNDWWTRTSQFWK